MNFMAPRVIPAGKDDEESGAKLGRRKLLCFISLHGPNQGGDPADKGPAEKDVQSKNIAQLAMVANGGDDRRYEIDGQNQDEDGR